eukprot:308313-Amphidinium_carterae.1
MDRAYLNDTPPQSVHRVPCGHSHIRFDGEVHAAQQHPNSSKQQPYNIQAISKPTTVPYDIDDTPNK